MLLPILLTAVTVADVADVAVANSANVTAVTVVVFLRDFTVELKKRLEVVGGIYDTEGLEEVQISFLLTYSWFRDCCCCCCCCCYCCCCCLLLISAVDIVVLFLL